MFGWLKRNLAFCELTFYGLLKSPLNMPVENESQVRYDNDSSGERNPLGQKNLPQKKIFKNGQPRKNSHPNQTDFQRIDHSH